MPVVTTLFLIRHGATEGSQTGCYRGGIDVPLSEQGVEQVNQTADFLEHYLKTVVPEQRSSAFPDMHPAGSMDAPGDEWPTLEAVYCSDLSRSARSAEIIAGPQGLQPILMKEFRERSFGRWEGLSFLEIRDRFPDQFRGWADNPLAYRPPEGESAIEVRDRVMKAFERVLAKHKGASLSIVAHGGVNRVILCEVLGAPLENIFRIEQNFAALNVIEFWDDGPVVRCMNVLPEEFCQWPRRS